MPTNVVQVPLEQLQLLDGISVNVPLSQVALLKPESVTLLCRDPQLIVLPPGQTCVPPGGQKLLLMVSVTFPDPSTLHAVLDPLASGAVACHDEIQFVVPSVHPNVLFQSLGKASQTPS